MTAPTSGTHKRGKHRNGNGAPPTVVQLPPVRVPPHNLPAERSLLGGVFMFQGETLKEVSAECSAADFYRDAHRRVYAAMLSLDEDGTEINPVSVCERLSERGDLEAVGGAECIDQLYAETPNTPNLAYYAKLIREKARERRIIEAATAIAQLGYEHHGAAGDFVEEAERRLRAALDDAGTRKALIPSPVQISRASLSTAPSPRSFLLRDATTGRGISIVGKVGLFAAAGGTGKSSAFGQLAIACATGLTWFGPGGWAPCGTMRVLLLAGEDDEDELSRRLYFAAKDMGAIGDEAMDLIARNVDAIPLAGMGCALTTDSWSEATLLPETAFAVAVRNHLREQASKGRPYGLLLIDPLSRFAGFDVEKDNASATRWIQVVETFTTPACGSPAVKAAHHLRKRSGDDREDSAVELIRGASALKDGVRWAAVLEQQKRTKDGPDLLTLRIVKANGVPPQREPLILCRPEGSEGVLRVATQGEIATNEKLLEQIRSKEEMALDVRQAVRAVMDPARAYSRNDLVRLSKRRKGLVLDAVSQLLAEGAIEEPRRGVIRVASGNREPPREPPPQAGQLFGSDGSGPASSSPPAPFRGQREAGTGEQKAASAEEQRPDPGDRGVAEREPGTGNREPPREER